MEDRATLMLHGLSVSEMGVTQIIHSARHQEGGCEAFVRQNKRWVVGKRPTTTATSPPGQADFFPLNRAPLDVPKAARSQLMRREWPRIPTSGTSLPVAHPNLRFSPNGELMFLDLILDIRHAAGHTFFGVRFSWRGSSLHFFCVHSRLARKKGRGSGFNLPRRGKTRDSGGIARGQIVQAGGGLN